MAKRKKKQQKERFPELSTKGKNRFAHSKQGRNQDRSGVVFRSDK